MHGGSPFSLEVGVSHLVNHAETATINLAAYCHLSASRSAAEGVSVNGEAKGLRKGTHLSACIAKSPVFLLYPIALSFYAATL
jgi:hypothetical protein